jgi:hypothetical protein
VLRPATLQNRTTPSSFATRLYGRAVNRLEAGPAPAARERARHQAPSDRRDPQRAPARRTTRRTPLTSSAARPLSSRPRPGESRGFDVARPSGCSRRRGRGRAIPREGAARGPCRHNERSGLSIARGLHGGLGLRGEPEKGPVTATHCQLAGRAPNRYRHSPR